MRLNGRSSATLAYVWAWTVVCLLGAAALLWGLWMTSRGRGVTSRPRADAAPPVFVINLPKNTGRLAAFRADYLNSDLARLPLTRFSAVDGSALDWSTFLTPEALEQLLTVQATGLRQDHPDLTSGAVGCYLSHLEVWKRIVDSGRPYGIVFEDDALLPPDTLATLNRAMGDAPEGWDLLLLGWEGRGDRVGPHLLRMANFLRLHAYAISRAAAARLCGTMLPIRQQIDWELNARGLKVYGVDPAKVGVRWQGTDIQIPLRK